MASRFRLNSRLTKALPVGAINLPIPDLGGDLFSDTALHPDGTVPLAFPGWAVVQVLTATVFDATTQCNIAGLAGGPSIPAGTLLYGMFSAIKLTSGSIIAYRAGEA
jgi:hypothetical protein